MHLTRHAFPLVAALALLAVAAPAENIPINATTCDITYSTSHSDYPGTKAFDGYSNKGGRWLASKSSDAYVQTHFKSGTAYRPTGYTVVGLTDSSYATRTVKEFLLKGSNDGVSWTTLDHQTDQTGWGDKEQRTFSLSSSDAYSWFRFEMPANNGAADYTGICELILTYDPSTLEPASVIAPAGAVENVSRYTTLAWLCPSANVTYDVYLGTRAELGEDDRIASGVTAMEMALPSPLAYGTTYHWRVDVSDGSRTLTGATTSFTTLPTPSGLVAEERFERLTAGAALAGQGSSSDGWESSWLAPNGNVTTVVTNATLAYDGGKVHIHGGNQAVFLTGKSGQSDTGAMRRDFTPQDDSPIYMSFLVQPSDSGQQLFAVLLRNRSNGDSVLGVGADIGYNSGKINAECNAGNPVRTASKVDVTGGETYFVVCRFTKSLYNDGSKYTYTRTDILVNPTTLEEPATGWTSASTTKAPNSILNRFFLRTDQGAASNAYLLDELRIGHDWASVVPKTLQPTVLLFR